MKTKYGNRLVKEASKNMKKISSRKNEIAEEFKRARASHFGDEYENSRLSALADEFEACEQEWNSYQQLINRMIRIEQYLPVDME